MGNSALERPCVLLVDDREENLLALESLLQNSTLELFKATSGNAALGLLIEREFALVLLDVQMPEMDGFEIAELMHGNAETRHVPIIFVSAINKEDRYVQKGHAMGAVDYLFKPIDPDILRAKVQVFCELYRQKQALQQEILERKQAEERRNWEVQVREAESVVRLKVASMDQTEGLCDVVGVIRKQLDRLGVKYDTCSIQIVNEEGTDFISIGDVPHNDFGFWTKILAGSWEKSTSHPEAYPWIIDVWKSGKPRYDPECGALGGKSLIDVPFSQGTLAINALHSHAFCQADVAVLQRFAEVLSEAYTRFRDLIRNTYLEDQLRQSQKMEAIGQLTAGMAHNFNNRLMVIMNSLELMAHQGGADPETLQTAETSTEQAAAMIEQLLHFARADKPLQLNPVDLSAVLQETLTLARQTIDPKMDIDYKLAVNLPPLFGDANQLGQVLMNLLLNARDALEEGAPTSPGIQVRADAVQVEADALQAYAHAAPGPYIRIQVADNGIGMDEETQERIFEPFFTTKSVDKGTGLGLATVYGMVQEHRGWIECESQPGAGTTFSVYLPVSREDPAASEEADKFASIPRGQETLLVIEDEEILRQSLVSELERYGYTVLAAADGQEGWQIYQHHRDEIDLVVLDLWMPRMSGQQVLANMRTLDPAVKVVVSTGYAEQPEKLVGARAMLLKPHRAGDALRTIRQVLDE